MRTDQGSPPPKPKVVKRSSPPPKTEVQATSGYKKPVARKAVTPKAAPAPRTDAQTSGRGYGLPRAAAYKATPAGRAPVLVRTKAGKKALSPTDVIRLNHLVTATLHHEHEPLGMAANYVLGKLAGLAPRSVPGIAALSPPASSGKNPAAEIVTANVKEAVKHPGTTIKGLGDQVVGLVGGVGQIGLPLLKGGVDLTTGHPGRALSDVKQTGQALGRIPGQVAKDYSYRYGPLVKGDYKGYEKRVHKVGADKGLADIASAATIGGAATRGVTRAVISKLPKGEEFLNAARPTLRTTGGEAVSQTLSHKPTRVLVQRTVDKARQVAAVKLPSRKPSLQESDLGRLPALQPRKSAITKSIERHNRKVTSRGTGILAPIPKRPDEVVPILSGKHTAASTGAGKAQRVAISRESSRSYIANKHEQTVEISNGAMKGLAGLTGKQRHATFHVLQGMVPLHGTLSEIKQALVGRERQIVAAHVPEVATLLAKKTLKPAETARLDSLVKGFGGAGPKILHPHTELTTVRYLQKHAEDVFGGGNLGRLQTFHAAEVARGKRIVADRPALRDATAQARVVRPQGEMLGIKYEPDRALAQKVDESKAAHAAAVGEVNAAIRAHKAQIARSSEQTGVARTLVRQSDARVLQKSKPYRDAARALSLATKEFKDARTAFGNAHRNWDLWSPARRHEIETRAANAENALAAAKTNFATVKAAAVKKQANLIDKRPLRSLSTLEAERARLVETQQAITRTKQAERAAAQAHKEAKAAAKRGEVNNDAYNLAYVAQVRQAAHARNLPDAAYFQHEKRPLARVSNRTAANLARAVAGPKASEMRLFNEGRAVTSPEAYVRGLADTIKVKHQWPAVANVVDQHAFSWSRGATGKGMTVEQLRNVIDKRGLRHGDVTFINPGRVRDGHSGAVMTAGEAEAAITNGDHLAKTSGYFALPNDAAKELLANTRPSGKAVRVAGRLQGLQSTAILGLNPSWEGMQIAANTLQSTVGMHGNMLELVKGEPWYRSLPAHDRGIVDRSLGVGLYEGQTTVPRLGSHQGALGAAAEQIGQVPLIRVGGKALRVTDINPTKLMFRVDAANNSFFRRAVFANAVKRQAFRDLTTNIGHAQAAVAQVADLLRLKPSETVADAMHRVLKDPAKVERAAAYTNEVLGDYLRYTHRERMFKNAIMFYGFMRYATKTLFYTLPVQHPLAAELALKIGQLHDNEVKQIFGGQDVPPWVYARAFQYDSRGHVIRHPLLDKNGKQMRVNGVPISLPESIDLSRINPLTGPVTDVVQSGPQAAFGLMSPMVQAVVNIAAKKNLQQDRPLTTGGSAEAAKSLSIGDMARIFANEGIVQPTFPGRLLAPKGPQSDDALPGSPRPIVYKSVAAREKHAATDAAQLRGSAALEQQLFPLFNPKPDTTPIALAAHGGPVVKLTAQIKRAETRAKKLLDSGQANDGLGYKTPEYLALRAHIKHLNDERTRLLARPKHKTVRLKNPPATAQELEQRHIQRQLDRLKHPGQQAQEELNRQLERVRQIAGGG